MANYWYWDRHLRAVVLPGLKKLYEFYEQHIVPAMERQGGQRAAKAEAAARRAPTTLYADPPAVSEDLRTDGVMEECELVQTLAVYTNATCEALYLEASRFLLLLHRKEGLSIGEEQSASLPMLGDLPGAFAAQGIDLTRLEGFDAYDLLRIILHCQGHIRGDAGEALQELQRRRPHRMTPSPAGRGMALVQPAEVKQLYEDLCKFLRHVIEALHLS